MQDFQAMLSSPEFMALPESERAKVAEHILPQMEEFKGLADDNQKAQVLTHVVQNGLPAKVEKKAAAAPAPAVPKPATTAKEPVFGTPPSLDPPDQKASREALIAAGKSLFQGRDRRDVSGKEIAGEAAGGAAGGAVSGVAGPVAMQAAGKALEKFPNPYVKALGVGAELAGKAWGHVPVSARVIQGSAGGAAMGAAGKVAEGQGVAPIVSGVLQLTASGVGEVGAIALTRGAVGTASIISNLLRGTPAGTARALGESAKQPTAYNLKIATSMKEELLGKPKVDAGIPGYVEPIRSAQLADDLRRADPSLLPTGSASEQYRNRLFSGVTELANKGTFFRDSQEFAQFMREAETKTKLGEIPVSDLDYYRKALGARSGKYDPLTTASVRDRLAERTDDLIREGAKSAEKGPAHGYSAVEQRIDSELKGSLQERYNQWLQRVGQGKAENLYRSTFRQEKVAEAKDTLAHIFGDTGYTSGDKKVVDTVANLGKDPELKKIALSAAKDRLAETPADKIMPEFERLNKLMVKSGMLSDRDKSAMMELDKLRQAATKVKSIVDTGERTKAWQRIQRIAVAQFAQQAGAAVGGLATRENRNEQ
jgi:hypothetical protein